jgi:hypothetical protein
VPPPLPPAHTARRSALQHTRTGIGLAFQGEGREDRFKGWLAKVLCVYIIYVLSLKSTIYLHLIEMYVKYTYIRTWSGVGDGETLSGCGSCLSDRLHGHTLVRRRKLCETQEGGIRVSTQQEGAREKNEHGKVLCAATSKYIWIDLKRIKIDRYMGRTGLLHGNHRVIPCLYHEGILRSMYSGKLYDSDRI